MTHPRRRVRVTESFFEQLDCDVALHLTEVKAYTSGMVALRYAVGRPDA